MNKAVQTETGNEKRAILSNWSFKQAGEQEWLPAIIPGCVHTDLLKNNKIPDPFYGKNELDLQWIDKVDWKYQTRFDVSGELFSSSRLELVFNGLDTYADVSLNGQRILTANNMFRTWTADVKSLLKREGNLLEVHFHSPIGQDSVKLDEQGYNLPAVNDHSEDGEVGDKNLSVFARKAPYHYGWDWGPRFVTSGLWKEVELVGWSESRITDVFIHQKKVTASEAELNVVLEIESEEEYQGIAEISAEGLDFEAEVNVSAGLNTVSLDVSIENPKLWWSRGLGDQHLYHFTAVLLKDGQKLTEKKVRTGLRSMKLVREKDAEGKTFYIELNGVPVFAKGANHIPNDSFVTEVTEERYKHEIMSAVESNMNMLRVWGGGIYEYDVFYELCDEHGILVWQDFMFACSMYPGDADFLENVKAEAEENVKRLRNHPSIALWCGNNEMDTAWSEYDETAGWGWKQQYTPEERKEIWEAYDTVFHQILPRAVEKFSPGEDYWPSSPMADWTGDQTQHSHYSSASGDLHYWDVWHGLKPFEEYNDHVGRFMSEYGFQSFPEAKTVESYAASRDMELESDVMLHHQKNDRGNYLIKEYMDKYLPEPKDFPSFLYMSQVLQAEGIKMAIEAHRRQKPYCMGTLYWQMNDCWPVASWSSMDYYGRWKALHYYAKRSFRDIMISIDGTKGDKISVHVVSDNLKDVEGTVSLSLLDFNGNVLMELAKQAAVKANTGEIICSFSTEELLGGHNADEVMLTAKLEQEGEVVDLKEHYFVSLKDLILPDSKILVEEVPESGGSEFIITADTLSKQVMLSTSSEGIFTDNYFDLIPGESKKVTFLSRESGFSPATPLDLTVHSMVDFIKR
ncbi:glycoside hydrolase family 2 protein [Bacillus haikouensis]|uniref:beta-mannosidase n=1 Tax=Bacillus haikouensis TaxID=1510468 RepID=UPI001557D926|nr:glycoside hydrolase family 2 protein [Bacillus haikouensis]NQD67657.1 glycoside hydrolase family 2 protein [Bacillus haikouensis]